MKLQEEVKLYTLDEVANMTGLKQSNLRYWAAEGKIQAQKVGRQWRLTAEQVRLLANGTKDTMQDIDLTDIECRITSLVEKVTGKQLEDDDREELLDILETFMRAALTGKTEKAGWLE